MNAGTGSSRISRPGSRLGFVGATGGGGWAGAFPASVRGVATLLRRQTSGSRFAENLRQFAAALAPRTERYRGANQHDHGADGNAKR